MPVEKGTEFDLFTKVLRAAVERVVPDALDKLEELIKGAQAAQARQEPAKHESVWKQANDAATTQAPAEPPSETAPDKPAAWKDVKPRAKQLILDKAEWDKLRAEWDRATTDALVYSPADQAAVAFQAADYLNKEDLGLNFYDIWLALPRAVRLRMRDEIMNLWIKECTRQRGIQTLKDFATEVCPTTDEDIYL